MSKEISDIRQALRQQNAERCALATVVRVEGSSFRKVGARMLISESGQILAGCVSGGCLEADVVERAGDVIAAQQPCAVRYDTRFDESEIVFGWGTGCKGMIEVLLEPLTATNIGLTLPLIADEYRESFVMATFYGQGHRTVERVLIDSAGHIVESNAKTVVPADILDLALETLAGERSQTKDFPVGSVCVEYLAPSRSLVIYGGGPDAAALADLAYHVGWTVTVADHRPVGAGRFTTAGRRLVCRPETLFDDICVDDQMALVSMSHNYLIDLELLRSASASKLRYVGVLGADARSRRLKDDLARSECEDLLSGRLHAPVGLSIGASTPEMIALSIVAEIESAFAKPRDGAACPQQATKQLA